MQFPDQGNVIGMRWVCILKQPVEGNAPDHALVPEITEFLLVFQVFVIKVVAAFGQNGSSHGDEMVIEPLAGAAAEPADGVWSQASDIAEISWPFHAFKFTNGGKIKGKKLKKWRLGVFLWSGQKGIGCDAIPKSGKGDSDFSPYILEDEHLASGLGICRLDIHS